MPVEQVQWPLLLKFFQTRHQDLQSAVSPYDWDEETSQFSLSITIRARNLWSLYRRSHEAKLDFPEGVPADTGAFD